MKRVTQKQYINLLRKRFKRAFGENAPKIQAAEWNEYTDNYKMGLIAECATLEIFNRALDIVMSTRGLYMSGEKERSSGGVFKYYHLLHIKLTCRPPQDRMSWETMEVAI